MPAHYEAWSETLLRYELEMDEDRFYALGGWPTLKIAELLIRERGASARAEEIAHHKEIAFQRHLDSIRAIEPVVAVVRQHQGQLPLAVATGATRLILDRVLAQIGLSDAFQALVSSDEVAEHKPHPAVFLEAARRLGVAPEKCLVYEDTDPGMEAARRAGMRSIDVRTFYKPRRVTA